MSDNPTKKNFEENHKILKESWNGAAFLFILWLLYILSRGETFSHLSFIGLWSIGVFCVRYIRARSNSDIQPFWKEYPSVWKSLLLFPFLILCISQFYGRVPMDFAHVALLTLVAIDLMAWIAKWAYARHVPDIMYKVIIYLAMAEGLFLIFKGLKPIPLLMLLMWWHFCLKHQEDQENDPA